MNCWLTTAGANVRPRGKCYSITGSFCLVLLLLFVAQTSTRPTDEDDEALGAMGDDAEYGKVDNVEIHHVKIIDGVMHEDHPIVMYKEDFVNEDFDPGKNKTQRKYKNIDRQRRQNHTEQYNALKPEKLYFDVLPQAPIVVSDETNDNETKFDVSSIRAELVPLVSSDSDKINEAPSKAELLKRPKKYHKRQRRDTEQHTIRKRNPYYRKHTTINTYPAYVSYADGTQYLPPRPSYIAPAYLPPFTRHPVRGKPPNQPVELGNRGDFEDGIWGRRPGTTTSAPPQANRPPPSLWHDSNPENFDFSVYSTTVAPATERPNNRRPSESTNSNSLLHLPAASQSLPASAPASTQFPALAPESLTLSHSAFEQEAREAAARVFFLGDVTASPQATNSACEIAEHNCCERSDLSDRFYCFELQKCKLSVADISAMCD